MLVCSADRRCRNGRDRSSRHADKDGRAFAGRGFDRRYLTSLLAMLAGLLVIYAGGAFWLAFLGRGASGVTGMGLPPALAAGVLPFVIPDLVKLAFAAGVVPAVWRLTGRR